MDRTDQDDSTPATPAKRAAAFFVHIFTAFGAGVALLALLEAVREHWAAMLARESHEMPLPGLLKSFQSAGHAVSLLAGSFPIQAKRGLEWSTVLHPTAAPSIAVHGPR